MHTTDHFWEVQDGLASLLFELFQDDLVLKGVDQTVESGVPDQVVVCTCVHPCHILQGEQLGVGVESFNSLGMHSSLTWSFEEEVLLGKFELLSFIVAGI